MLWLNCSHGVNGQLWSLVVNFIARKSKFFCVFFFFQIYNVQSLGSTSKYLIDVPQKTVYTYSIIYTNRNIYFKKQR